MRRRYSLHDDTVRPGANFEDDMQPASLDLSYENSEVFEGPEQLDDPPTSGFTTQTPQTHQMAGGYSQVSHERDTTSHTAQPGGYPPFGFPIMSPYVPYGPFGLPYYGGSQPQPNYDQFRPSSDIPPPPPPQFSLRLDDSQLQHLTAQTHVKEPQSVPSSGMSVKIDDAQFHQLTERRGGGESRPYQPLSIPTYKAGQDWTSFQKEFLNEMQLLDVPLNKQLLYLRRAIPEDGQALIRAPRVDTLTEAIIVLTKLYQPPRSSVEIQADFLEIKQRKGESLRNLAARLQDASNWYDEKFNGMTKEDKERMVMDQFIRAIYNEKIQERLITESFTSIESALAVAEKMDRFLRKSTSTSAPQKVRMVTEPSDSKYDKLREEKALLEAKLAKLELEHQTPSGPRGRGNKPAGSQGKLICWWCRKEGHMKRNCAKWLAKQAKMSPPDPQPDIASEQIGGNLNS